MSIALASRRVVAACAVLLAASPALSYPGSAFPFIVPKAVIFYAIGTLMLFAFALLVRTDAGYLPPVDFLSLAWAILLAVLSVTAFFGVDFAQSAWSIPERGIGLVFLLCAFACFVTVSAYARMSGLRLPVSVSFAASVIAALVGVGQWFAYPDRPGSVFGNAAFFSSYLLLNAFLGIWLMRSRPLFSARLRAVIAFFIALDAACIFLTGTRGAIVGLFFGCVVLIVSDAVRSKRRSGAMAALVIAALAGGFFLMRGASVWQRIPGLARFSGASFSDLAPGRAAAWQGALAAIRQRPFAGWGWDNFSFAFDAAYRPEFARVSPRESFFSKPHNIFLEHAVAGGIPCLIAFLLFILAFARGMRQADFGPRERAPLAGFLAAYCASQFFLFDSFGSAVPLILAGALVSSRSPGYPLPFAGFFRSAFGVSFAGVLASAVLVSAFQMAHADHFRFAAAHAQGAGDAAAGWRLWDAAIAAGGPYADDARLAYVRTLQSAVDSYAPVPDARERSRAAMARLSDAIARHPKEYRYRIAYADAAVAFSAYDPAYLVSGVQEADAAALLAPGRIQSRYVQAKILAKSGDKKGALAVMREAADRNPSLGDAHFMYGMAAFAAGEPALGLEEMGRAHALGRDPQDAYEAKTVADNYGDADRYDEALRYYAQALRFDGNDPDTLFNRALVLYYKGERASARQEMAGLARRFPGFASSARYRAARPILIQLGL